MGTSLATDPSCILGHKCSISSGPAFLPQPWGQALSELELQGRPAGRQGRHTHTRTVSFPPCGLHTVCGPLRTECQSFLQKGTVFSVSHHTIPTHMRGAEGVCPKGLEEGVNLGWNK